MEQIFLLSKQNVRLAEAEVLSLVKANHELIDNLLIAENEPDLKKRLGFTHSVHQFLFKCKRDKLEGKIKRYDWQKIYKKNFCVRTHGQDRIKENGLADIIWAGLDNPRADLENPETKIEFFFRKEEVIAALFLYDTDKSHLKRKAHMRPELHPTAMHPGLAKACINLTGLEKGKIMDPFCGSGGILIEAGLMGFDVLGYDIDRRQIQRAEKNLRHYKIKGFELEKKDATKINRKAGAIVTDLPYGRGSRAENIVSLYEAFIKKSEKITKNMVVIFPDFVDHKKIIKKSGRKIEREFSFYVHKSLTRTIAKVI